MRKLLISSASQLSQLLNNNPALLTIPAFSTLSSLVQHINAQPKQGCNNCSGRSNPYAQLRPQLEAALSSMTDSDWLTMKSILNMDKVCYYRKELATNKLIQHCV